jgi:hypothetical protein
MKSKHFDLARWVDFVAGVVEPVERTVMEEHLSSGCQKCRSAARVAGRLKALGSSESLYQVPQYAVHYAKAIGSLQQPERVHILPRTITRLVFDSFREPLPAGIRGQRRITRHSRYEAGDRCLEMRQEHERGTPRVTLVGQITSRKEPGAETSGLEVVLTCGKQVIARAVSNQFGEFLLAYEPRARMRLYVRRPSTRCTRPGRKKSAGIREKL